MNLSIRFDSPQICIPYLDGNCRNNNCPEIHCSERYLWQSQLDDQWIDMPQVHSDELEEAYMDPEQNSKNLSSVNRETGERYFPDNSNCSVNFRSMTMHFGDMNLELRRLSTPSSVESSSKHSTLYTWYFRDETGKWIEYGDVNKKKMSMPQSATRATSIDIERHYVTSDKNTMDIKSSRHNYIIHFSSFTQLNISTNVSRPVRRRPSKRNNLQSENERGQSSFENSEHGNPNFRQSNASGWGYTESRYHAEQARGYLPYDYTRDPYQDYNDGYRYPPHYSYHQGRGRAGQHPSRGRGGMEAPFMPGYVRGVPGNVPRHGDYPPYHNRRPASGYASSTYSSDDSVSESERSEPQQAKKPNRKQPPSQKSQVKQKTPPNLHYKWQRQLVGGVWELIGLGRKVKKGELGLSEQIEMHYLQTPSKIFTYSSVKHTYDLDLKRLTETNKKSNVINMIRRVPKQPKADETAKENSESEKGPSKVNSDTRDSEANNCSTEDPTETVVEEPYAWFFKKGTIWVKYDSAKGHVMDSVDLEKHYKKDPKHCFDMIVKGVRHTFDLDKKTHSNEKTSTAICRALGSSLGDGDSTPPSPKREYDWFFMDDKNKLVKFGDHSIKKEAVTDLTSADIEKHYLQDPNKPLDIKSSLHRYVLDLKAMTQTNKQSNTSRTIKRIVRPISDDATAQTGAVNDPGHDDTKSKDKDSLTYEWFFQDEGGWTKFGDITALDMVSNTTSDDVEKHFQTNHDKKMDILVGQSKYSLDLVKMTQTKVSSGKVRHLNRQPANTIKSSGAAEYVWYFQDPKMGWVKFGEMGSSADPNTITTSSEEIEKFYNKNGDTTRMDIKSKEASYTLDFKRMTQLNTSSKVMTPICRILENEALKKNQSKASKGTIGSKTASSVAEWYFMNDKEEFVKYGQSGDKNDPQLATQTTSADIEKHYLADPTKQMTIKSAKHEYILDFKNMIQINKQTLVHRKIQRKVTNKSHSPTKAGSSSGDTVSWEFQDDQQKWIKYGSVSSDNDKQCVTSVTSDDLEKQYQLDQTVTIEISSQKNTYIIDFVKMTQTNKNTNNSRPIRRVVSDNSIVKYIAQKVSNLLQAKKATHEWMFLDEHGQWIRYGDISTANDKRCATSADSDYLEKEYSKDPTQTISIQSNKHTYNIDFKNLTQTNVKTNVVRKVQRAPVNTVLLGGSSNGVSSDISANGLPKFPSNWTNVNSEKLTCVTLQSSDPDYTKYVGHLQQTLGNRQIIQVVRIQHPFLWHQYVCEKNNMKHKNPNVNYQEKYLFHGTNSANIQSICDSSFDWRRAGSHVGTAYGQGIYFSNK